MTKDNTNFVDDSNFIDLQDVALSYSFGEARPVRPGASFKLSTFSPGQHVDALSETDPSDRSEIEALVLAFESLQPTDVEGSLGKLTTSPYQSINNGQVQTIDAQALSEWVSSAEYREIQQAYEGATSHDIKLVGFNVTLIDRSTGSVIYTISERLPSGRVMNGTSSVIVVKNGGRWQIAVHCQHPI